MFDRKVFEGRTALVTGGGSGIGFGIAAELGALGANVMLAARNTERLTAAADRLTAEGIAAAWTALDVRDPASVEAAVDAAYRRFGTVDILINNAAGNFVCPSEQLSPNGWRAVVGIVLDGTFFMCREVGKRWIEAGQPGQIVNIVATYAWTGAPGVAPSASAKAGVCTLTQTLAAEWAPHGIRVNAVAPGPIKTDGAGKALWDSPDAVKAITDEVPLGRFGEVVEISRTVAFLVSDYASYITGDVLVVDGGEWLGKGLGGLRKVQEKGLMDVREKR